MQYNVTTESPLTATPHMQAAKPFTSLCRSPRSMIHEPKLLATYNNSAMPFTQPEVRTWSPCSSASKDVKGMMGRAVS